MRSDFNNSEIRYSEKRYSDRGVGDDVTGLHGKVPKQRILIPKKRFPRVPLKEVSRGFQAMQLPDQFEDYDITDVDGRISLKELMKVTGTVENLVEAFAAFDKNGEFMFSLVVPTVSNKVKRGHFPLVKTQEIIKSVRGMLDPSRFQLSKTRPICIH